MISNYNYNYKIYKYYNFIFLKDKNLTTIKNTFYKIMLFSFKNIYNWNFKLLTIKYNLKKFSFLKSPFKYNKNREQFFLRKYLNILYMFSYSPKIYELLFFQYLFLSNTKFFNLLKFEQKKKW